MYYRGAAAAIVVYDITRASSFKTLKHWVEELKTKGPKDIAIAIAGNKADLHDARVRLYLHLTCVNLKNYTYLSVVLLILNSLSVPQEVDQEMAIAYAEEIGALYLETSAKDDTNVQDIFVKLST